MISNLKQILQKFKNFRLNTKNIIFICLAVLFVLLSAVYLRNSPSYLTYDAYEKLLNENQISRAIIDKDEIILTFNKKQYIVLKQSVNLQELYKKVPLEIANDNTQFFEFFYLLLTICIFSGVIFLINKKNQSQIKYQVKQNQNISEISPVISKYTFADVAGIDEVKKELFEIVDFLKNPSKYQKFGVCLPKGVLMVGSPGVGKTLIAKAVAGEAGVPFFYQSGSSFAEIFVGVGAKRVRELFAKAKAKAPSIIFIDEIDAVGKSRGGNRNDERETTLNQLLTEMDGFEESSGVIVIAATNKIDLIDEALLRPGRFDRRIYVSLPNFQERIEILKIYLKDKNFNVDLEKLSKICVGFSGAALATLVNEAALNAMRNQKEKITLQDFEDVKNKVQIGSKKMTTLSDDERKIQSIYQGAKALSAYWFGIEFDKISLLEDRFNLDEKEIESKTEILNKIKVRLSGHAALKIFKNDNFTNANQDLKSAQKMAESMILDYFMGDNLTPQKSDLNKILNDSYAEVCEFLQKMNLVLAKISTKIYNNESIDKNDIKEIINNNFEEKNDKSRNFDD